MKNILILAVILLILAGAGYYVYSTKLQKTPNGGIAEKKNNMITSIQDALSKSLSLQCLFTTTDGTKVTAYLKAGAIRGDSQAKDPKQSGNYIMRDKKLYFWQKNSKQGVVMEMTKLSVTPAATPGKTAKEASSANSSEKNQGDTFLSMLEKFKNSCKPAVLADSLFLPPSDVTFTDFSKMMPAIPTGQQSSENVQKMMEQYRQQAGN